MVSVYGTLFLAGAMAAARFVDRAYSLTGKRKDALDILIDAERLAPEHVRQHHLAKKVVMTLIHKSPGKPSVELGKLAERVNVVAAV